MIAEDATMQRARSLLPSILPSRSPRHLSFATLRFASLRGNRIRGAKKTAGTCFCRVVSRVTGRCFEKPGVFRNGLSRRVVWTGTRRCLWVANKRISVACVSLPSSRRAPFQEGHCRLVFFLFFPPSCCKASCFFLIFSPKKQSLVARYLELLHIFERESQCYSAPSSMRKK